MLLRLILVALFSMLSTQSSFAFIIGGERVRGATASIGFDTPFSSCSGTMIRANVILTAAHCITDHAVPQAYPDSEIHIKSFRTVDGFEVERVYKAQIEQVHIHSSWLLAYELKLKENPNEIANVSDVALIVLKENVSLPTAAVAKTLPLELKVVSIIGGGADNIREPQSKTGYQKKIELSVIDQNPSVIYMDGVDSRSGAVASTFFGDSGGGTFVETKNGELLLVGVNSHLFGDTENVYTFTKVVKAASSHLFSEGMQAWLAEKLAGLNVPSRPEATFVE